MKPIRMTSSLPRADAEWITCGTDVSPVRPQAGHLWHGTRARRRCHTGLKLLRSYSAPGGARQRPAAALVLVLWAITVLSLLAGGLSFVIRQDVAVAGLQKDRLIAHVLARAGVERAIAALTDDSTLADTLDDYCSDDPGLFQEISLEGGTFSVMHGSHDLIPTVEYGVSDESGKLNVNVATREQLMALPDMTEPIADAIIDWRDNDDNPGGHGIESSHYRSLPHPYDIRNGRLRTVRELLLVRDVTPELLYGEDANCNGLLDPNEDDGETSPPLDNGDGRLDRGWFAYLTTYSYEKNTDSLGRKRLNVKSADAMTMSTRLMLEDWAARSIVKARDTKQLENLIDLLDVERDSETPRPDPESDINTRGEDEQDNPVTLGMFKRIVDYITLDDADTLPGRINVNTAPRAVLMTLPDVDEELADAIVRARDNLGGLASIGDLLGVGGLTKEKFAQMEKHVTVRSSVFRIVSRGEAASGLAKATIECVVNRGGDMPRAVYWLESAP